jgi:hypothetical protein
MGKNDNVIYSGRVALYKQPYTIQKGKLCLGSEYRNVCFTSFVSYSVGAKFNNGESGGTVT